MAELPILPLKIDALLSDTTHLSAEEFGVYCRLLFAMWRHGGSLPNDGIELARIGGVPHRRWKAIAERVMRPMTLAGGRVSQKRLSSTWLDVQELRKKRAHAAEKRWGNSKDANAYANGHAKPMQRQQSKSSANQNQNQIEPLPLNSEPRASPAQNGNAVEKTDDPARSLATAPGDGALTREPLTEQTAEGLSGKKPSDLTRAELDEIILSKKKTAAA
jgi:uncharacterized protein YdaU (DUF1376 family)